MTSEDDTLRMGVLGAGFMGETHARCYSALHNTELVRIYAPSSKRSAPLAEELDTTWTESLGDILNDETIDAVSVCLPTPQHRDTVVAALDQGKHVLCEKPLALTEKEGQTIVRAAEAADTKVMVGHVLRFWPEYVELHRVVSSGTLGRPVAGFASRRSPFPNWSELYRAPEFTGGAVVDLQIHDLDILCWIFGEPEWVNAAGVRNPQTGGWDHNFLTLSYEGGVAASEGSHIMPERYPFSSSLRVVCERGCAEYHFRAGSSEVETGTTSDSLLTVCSAGEEPRTISVETRDPYRVQIEYFVQCVRDHARPERSTPQDALRALRIALAARESLELGARVGLD